MNDNLVDETKDEIELEAWFERALRRWPLIVGLGLLGSLIGLAFTTLNPPLYESESTIGVTIQYSISEPLELVVEDRAIAMVEDLILADDTLQRVLDRLPAAVREERSWHVPSDLRQALRLDRRLTSWGLVAGDEDPVFSAQLAELWEQEALAVVTAAIEHAWTAAMMVNQAVIESGKSPAYEIKGATRLIWQCQIIPQNVDPELLDGAIRRELELSQGVFPTTVVKHLRAPVVPEEPVLWARAPIVLSSSLAGVLAGLWVGLSLPARRPTD